MYGKPCFQVSSDTNSNTSKKPDSGTQDSQAQVAVGNSGFPVLCGILREERADVEMVRGALECLAIALGHPAAGGAAASAQVSTNLRISQR